MKIRLEDEVDVSPQPALEFLLERFHHLKAVTSIRQQFNDDVHVTVWSEVASDRRAEDLEAANTVAALQGLNRSYRG